MIVAYGRQDPAVALDLSAQARFVGCDPSGPIGELEGDLILPDTTPSGGYLIVVEPESEAVIEILCS